MPSDPRFDERPKKFGRIDPVCWLPVVALVIMAVLLILGKFAVAAIVPIGMAGLLLLFDSWANRPQTGNTSTRRRPATPRMNRGTRMNQRGGEYRQRRR